MGLSLCVGYMAEAKAEAPEEFGEIRTVFEQLSAAMVKSGYRPHNEPEEQLEQNTFSCQMWGYSGLHHLRRFAACHYFGHELYVPNRELADGPEALVTEYYRLSDPSRDQPLPFEHLMQHSDCDGFFLPQDFQAVVVTRNPQISGDIIGSSVQLLKECRQLALLLELPLDLDMDAPELWAAADDPGKGSCKWQKYGIESFSCLRLIRACEVSVRAGAALVFC